MKNICLTFIALFLCACNFSSQGEKVTIYDAYEFYDIKKDFWQDLDTQGKVDFIYARKNGRNLFSSIPNDTGNILYNHLSLSFRYAKEDFSRNELTFYDYTMPNAFLVFRQHGFLLSQGNEQIDTVLLATTDWNYDGNVDFLVLCRITKIFPTTEKNVQKKRIQEHVLLIEDMDDDLILAETIFVRTYQILGDEIITEVYRDKKVIQGYMHEEVAPLEYKQGQENILLSPEQLKKENTPQVIENLKEKELIR